MSSMSYIEITLLVIVLMVYAFALGAIVKTKTEGWGRFSISIMLLTLVLFSGTVALVMHGLEFPQFANLLFAIAGFAGALLTGKSDGAEPSSRSKAQSDTPGSQPQP